MYSQCSTFVTQISMNARQEVKVCICRQVMDRLTNATSLALLRIHGTNSIGRSSGLGSLANIASKATSEAAVTMQTIMTQFLPEEVQISSARQDKVGTRGHWFQSHPAQLCRTPHKYLDNSSRTAMICHGATLSAIDVNDRLFCFSRCGGGLAGQDAGAVMLIHSETRHRMTIPSYEDILARPDKKGWHTYQAGSSRLGRCGTSCFAR